MKYSWLLIACLIGCPLQAAEIPASTLLSNLSNTVHCSPSETTRCSYTVTRAIDFFNYLKICDQLVNWDIYFYSTHSKITLTADATYYCKLTIQVNKKSPPSIKECILSAANIQSITSNDARRELQQLSTHGSISPDTMKTVFKPIYDCLQQNTAPTIAPRFIKPGPHL